MVKRVVELRSAYNYDSDEVSEQSGLVCPQEESVVQQQFKDDSDINVIVKRFGLTGEMPVVPPKMPVGGDFTGISDFHDAMNLVRQAEEQFMLLPWEARVRFNHDPQALMDFLHDPVNREEAVKLGLVAKPPEVTRDVVKAIDEMAAKLPPLGPRGEEKERRDKDR